MPPKKKNDVKADKTKAKVDVSVPKATPKKKDAEPPAKPADKASKGKPKPEPKGKAGKKDTPKADPKDGKNDAKKAEDDAKMVKVVTKGGAAVDSLVPNKENYRVLQDGGKNYAATLNQANMDNNNNKFYIVQILLNEKTGQIFVWNRWGRVGVPGQNCLKGPFTKDVAQREYNNKVHEKTVKGDYKEIEIKYDDEEEKKPEPKKTKKTNNVASKIDPGLQKLINLIFDVNIMNTTMKEIGYDAKKMPLGKLGDNTIKEAYSVLNQISKELKGSNRQPELSRLSGEFFTLIPHDFGFQKMSNFVLRNEEQVKEKIKMLEAISDMKITTKLLDQEGDDNTSVLDQNYKKLGCSIKTLDKKGADFKLMKEYFDNTKGGFNKVTIGDIYEVVRDNEQKAYNEKLGNNMLLWHGSRITNFVGILSQGLRIAPPEAPVSGYLFGKGIYLADMAEKSIHYCRSYGSSKALILLIEGAIGNPNILLSSSYQAKELMEKAGKHSTKCWGSKAPPETCYAKHKNFIVPNGKPTPTGSGSYMSHNEFIVYNMNQARIRYILEMEMNGN